MHPAFRFLRPVPVLLGLIAATAAAHAAADPGIPIPAAADILSTLKKEHPRLLVSSNDFERLKARVPTEEPLHTWYVRLRKEGQQLLAASPSKYEIPDGLRLLDTSRRVLDRVQKFALLYRLDGDKRYADRAWQELDAAAHFKDWNTRHFLDTAEMTHAFAIGYDWLYDYWTPEQRETLRTAIVEKGIKPALEIENKKAWWAVASHNWNQVCNGGIGMGALAVADEEPALAADFLSKAARSIQIAMAEYGPDGAWREGPGYWSYATSYNVVFLAGLESALGTDFNLSRIAGFSETGTFPIFAAGPTGMTFNYADAHEGIVRCPALFWLAQKFHRPEFAAYERRVGGNSALDLIWYDADAAAAGSPPLDKYFRHSEVVTMRSAWDDTNALFIGLKAGGNQVNHSHLDLGSFVLDALGERWAVDPGSDNYNLPGYFDTATKRWTYYRLRAEGHNTLVIDPTNGPDQDPRAAATITKFSSTPEKAFAIADLTAAYRNSAQKVMRGIAMPGRGTMVVQDEIVSDRPADVRWFLHTPADVELGPDGTNAVLSRHGKRLSVVILSPEAARFEVLPAAPLATSPHPAGQTENKDIRVVAVHLRATTGVRLVVQLTPRTETNESGPAAIKPLADW